MNARLRLAAALGFTAAMACTGLWVDKGNAYRCDFAQPEGERDRACPPEWVCGVTGRCQRFQYEGPQFEGEAPLPQFTNGRSTHPRLLKTPIQIALASPHPRDLVVATTSADDGGQQGFVARGYVHLAQKTVPALPLTLAAVYSDERLAVRGDDGGTLVILGSGFPQLVREWDGGRVVDQLQALRTSAQLDGTFRIAAVRDDPLTPVGELIEQGPLFRLRPLAPLLDADAGERAVYDVQWAAHELFWAQKLEPGQVPVVVTNRAFHARTRIGASPSADGWTRLNLGDDLDVLGPLMVRRDRTGKAWAVAYRDALRDRLPRALSTWRLTQVPQVGGRLTRAWSDCSPCLGGRIVSFTTALFASGLSVDVLCEGRPPARALSLVRVVGSLAPEPSRLCQLEPLEPPLDLTEISFFPLPGGERRYAIDHSVADLVVIGGRHGQLWSGNHLGELTPLRLDRVPLALGTIEVAAELNRLQDGGRRVRGDAVDGGRSPMVVTDQYLAFPFSDDGFTSVRLKIASDIPLGGVLARGAVNEAGGWLLLSSGDLALLELRGDTADPDDPPVKLTFGPRLLDLRGAPAREPFHGEAVRAQDGGLVSMVLAADDSLYFWPSAGEATAEPNSLRALTPKLTPEPNSPIRSVTLERSPLATDGVQFVRGYLVTARDLYVFTLGGTPPRWDARPISLGAGEPIEVWMDHPRGGLGRVGYRSGEVYTLPGGFPLTRALFGSDAGTDRVLDFENLGGWPVALAESGLFVAHWDKTSDGKLDNKFEGGEPGKPMKWRRVKLPDGGEPWRGRPGLLQALRQPTSREGEVNVTRFVLNVFTGSEVFEVGVLERRDRPKP